MLIDYEEKERELESERKKNDEILKNKSKENNEYQLNIKEYILNAIQILIFLTMNSTMN